MYRNVEKIEFNLINVIIRYRKTFLIVFFSLLFISLFYQISTLRNVVSFKFAVGEPESFFKKILIDDQQKTKENYENQLKLKYIFELSFKKENFIKELNNILKKKIKYEKLKKIILKDMYIYQLNPAFFELSLYGNDIENSKLILNNISDLIMNYDFFKNIQVEREKYLKTLNNKLNIAIKKYQENLMHLQEFYINNYNSDEFTLEAYKKIVKQYIEYKNEFLNLKNNISVYQNILKNIKKKPINLIFLSNLKEINYIFSVNTELDKIYKEISKLKKKREQDISQEKIKEITKEINKKRKTLKKKLIKEIKIYLKELILKRDNVKVSMDIFNKKINDQPFKQLNFLSLKKSVVLSEDYYSKIVEEYIKSKLEFYDRIRINIVTQPTQASKYNYQFRKNFTTGILFVFIISCILVIIKFLTDKKIYDKSELISYINKNRIKYIIVDKNNTGYFNFEQIKVAFLSSENDKMILLDNFENECIEVKKITEQYSNVEYINIEKIVPDKIYNLVNQNYKIIPIIRLAYHDLDYIDNLLNVFNLINFIPEKFIFVK